MAYFKISYTLTTPPPFEQKNLGGARPSHYNYVSSTRANLFLLELQTRSQNKTRKPTPFIINSNGDDAMDPKALLQNKSLWWGLFEKEVITSQKAQSPPAADQESPTPKVTTKETVKTPLNNSLFILPPPTQIVTNFKPKVKYFWFQ